MWRVAVRAILAFGFSVFGRKIIAIGCAVLLLFATALLIDLKMYVSAVLAGVLVLVAVVVFFIQYRRQIAASRLRAQQQAEVAQRRAAASEARSEKVDRAKAKVADTVKGMTTGAAGVARSGFEGARDRVQGWRK